MASGASLLFLTPEMGQPPETGNSAREDRVNGHPSLDFSTSQDEDYVFTDIMPQEYSDATGITVIVHYAMSSATSSTCAWSVVFERLEEGAPSISDNFTTFGTGTDFTADTVPNPAGDIGIVSKAITKGANMDSIVAGDLFRMKIRRDVSRDAALGDAELRAVEIQET